MSKRRQIAAALTEKIKDIDGSAAYASNLYGNVFTKIKFWDEINDYPTVFVTTGTETREYQPGAFKWGYLNITVRIYVKHEEPEIELEALFDDIETIVDANGNMVYDEITGSKIEDIKISSINTDEGLLSPIGVGEISLNIMYDLESN